MSQDDSSVQKRRSPRLNNTKSYQKPSVTYVEARDVTFARYVEQMVDVEITHHQRTAHVQKFAFFIAALFFTFFVHKIVTRFVIWPVFPMGLLAFYTYFVFEEHRQHVVDAKRWDNARRILKDLMHKVPEQFFVIYLDKFPKQLKNTSSYKKIRRRHFELLCNLKD